MPKNIDIPIDKSRVVGCLDDGISVVVFTENDPMKVVIVGVSELFYSEIKTDLDCENILESAKKEGKALE